MEQTGDAARPVLGHAATACEISDQATTKEILTERKLTIPPASIVAEERLLAMVHDIGLLANIGRAVALLSYIIALSGSSDQCVINLHEAAAQIGQPYSTVKSWLTGLEQAGLIRKTLQGREGLQIQLDTERIQRAPVFSRIAARLLATAESLRAVQVTVADVVAHAQAGIGAELEAMA